MIQIEAISTNMKTEQSSSKKETIESVNVDKKINPCQQRQRQKKREKEKKMKPETHSHRHNVTALNEREDTFRDEFV